MRMTNRFAGILIAGALVLVGCGKSQQQQEGPPPVEMGGVKIDLPKLQQCLPADKQELHDAAGKVMMALRYGQYPEALAQLDKVAAADLTDAQKKVVNDVIAQVKQLMAKAPAKPAQ